MSPKLSGRIGGLRVHALHDSNAIAARARTGLDAKFVQEIQEAAARNGELLSPAELDRRAGYARKAHFARLSMLSAQARKRATP